MEAALGITEETLETMEAALGITEETPKTMALVLAAPAEEEAVPAEAAAQAEEEAVPVEAAVLKGREILLQAAAATQPMADQAHGRKMSVAGGINMQMVQ